MTEQQADDEGWYQVNRLHGGGIHGHALEQEEADGDDTADQEEDDARAAQLRRRHLRVGKIKDQWGTGHARRDTAEAGQDPHEDGIASTERELMMRELHEQQRNENDRTDEQLQLIGRKMRKNPEAEGLRHNVANQDCPNQLVACILPDEEGLHDAGNLAAKDYFAATP